MPGLTFDTGVLIALERRKQRAVALMRTARADGLTITVPAVVIAEWWQGRSDIREAVLESVDIEPMTEKLSKLTGEALAAVPDSTLVDAAVMASAAQRGDVVCTSDFEDLDRLRDHFKSVPRLLRFHNPT